MRRIAEATRLVLRAAAVMVCGSATLAAQERPAPAPSSAPRARVSGTVESGAAAIQQPLVRSGAAFYVAPSAELTARDATVGGSAVLATGAPAWQSFLGTGYARSPAMRDFRLIGSGQVLKTTGIAHTLHGDVGVEWRRSSGTTTGAVRATAGQMRFGGGWYRDATAGAAVMRSRGATTFGVEAAFGVAQRPVSIGTQLGVREVRATDSASFTARTLDFTPRMIWERSRLRADASLALRAVQQGGTGTRVGPQLSFTLQTARGVSLFVGGVQRLPDVRAGIPSGRTALLGVRVEGRRLLTRPVLSPTTAPTLVVMNGVLIVEGGAAAIDVLALRGDFTEWVPRTCLRLTARRFSCGAAPRDGTWRVAIRVNDGAWMQPGNLAAVADDFGSVEGVLMTGGRP